MCLVTMPLVVDRITKCSVSRISMNTEVKLNLRTNAEVFIRALMTYHPVHYRGTTYQVIKAGETIYGISEEFESDHDVFVQHVAVHGEKRSIRQTTLPLDFSLNNIFMMCSDMTEEERFDIISANVIATTLR